MRNVILIWIPLLTLILSAAFLSFACGWATFMPSEPGYGDLMEWIMFYSFSLTLAALIFFARWAYRVLKYFPPLICVSAVLARLPQTQIDVAIYAAIAAATGILLASFELMMVRRNPWRLKRDSTSEC